VIVLGIDAAWTEAHPSGVALLACDGDDLSGRSGDRADDRARDRTGDRTGDRVGRCRLVALAPSYASFVALAGNTPHHVPCIAAGNRSHDFQAIDWRARPTGGVPECDALIEACIAIAGAPPDVIAIDMPLSTRPIVGRRVADNAIASALGRYGLGVHTPTPDRPGPIAELMRAGFEAHGYRLATAGSRPSNHRASNPAPMSRSILEVFPHAAAIRLLGASYRVPYKLGRAAQYWPDKTTEQRKRAILDKWRAIRRGLDVDGFDLRMRASKRYEDALDAVVCAWVGVEFLAGRAKPYGDDTAAVWAW
jgi:predicted RNase H-like nuclease